MLAGARGKALRCRALAIARCRALAALAVRTFVILSEAKDRFLPRSLNPFVSRAQRTRQVVEAFFSLTIAGCQMTQVRQRIGRAHLAATMLVQHQLNRRGGAATRREEGR